jgi:hypothetical protein
MEILPILLDHLPSLLAALVVALVAWGVKKANLAKDAEELILACTKRVTDKAQEWLKIAMAPDSDGGAKVTAAELSAIRQKAWELVLEEAKGPVGVFIKTWGENRVKGMIGLILDKMGIKATA